MNAARQLQEDTVERFLKREASQLACVRAVLVDVRDDALDVLFVVDGDLFTGERMVLPIMHQLRDEFEEMLFDVMVMPASRYSKTMRWGQAGKAVYERSQ